MGSGSSFQANTTSYTNAISSKLMSPSNHLSRKNFPKFGLSAKPKEYDMSKIVLIQTRIRIMLAVRLRYRKMQELHRVLFQMNEDENENDDDEEDDEDFMEDLSPDAKNDIYNRNRFLRKTNIFDQKTSGGDYHELPLEFVSDAIISRYSPYDKLPAHIVIYPCIGYVIKTRNKKTNKKFFFNVCHHESVVSMVATPIREVNEDQIPHFDCTSMAVLTSAATNTLTTDDANVIAGLVSSVSSASIISSTPLGRDVSMNGLNTITQTLQAVGPVTVRMVDILLPSEEYEECFEYDEETESLVPINIKVRDEMTKQCIQFWNLSAGNDSVEEKVTYPKMKRGYIGEIIPLLFNLHHKSVHYLPEHSPWLHSRNSTSVVGMNTSNNNNNTVSSKQLLMTSSTTPIAATNTTGSNNNTSLIRTSLSTSASLSNTNKPSIDLPYAADFQSWAELSSVRTAANSMMLMSDSDRILLKLDANFSSSTSNKSNCSDIFGSNNSLSEVVVARDFPREMVPLFGPVHAAEFIATSQCSLSSSNNYNNNNASYNNNTNSNNTTAMGGNNPTSSSSIMSSEKHESTSNTNNLQVAGLKQPHAPAKSKNFRTSKPTAGPAVRPTNPKQTIVNTSSNNNINTNTNQPEQINNNNVEKNNQDNNALSFRRISKNKDGDEKSTFRSLNTTRTVTSNRITAVLETKNKVVIEPLQSAAQIAKKTITIPVYLVLSQGILYIYNRDPSKATYYPAISTNTSLNSRSKRKLNNSTTNLNSSTTTGNTTTMIPLKEYARIALTEDNVSTSHYFSSTFTKGAIKNLATYYLHFHSLLEFPHHPNTAPLEKNKTDNSNNILSQDHLALLFTRFSPSFPACNATIQFNSFSQLRTWKAYIRSHILLGAAIRSRISMYSNTVLINKLPIEIKKPTSKFESLSYTLQRGAIGGNSSSSNSTERVLLKGSVTVHKGILCFYEDGGGGGGGGITTTTTVTTSDSTSNTNNNNSINSAKLPMKMINLLNKVVTSRSEMQKDGTMCLVVTISSSSNANKIDTFAIAPRSFPDNDEFLFVKGTGKDDSTEFIDVLQRHIDYATNQIYSYLIPLLEHYHSSIHIPISPIALQSATIPALFNTKNNNSNSNSNSNANTTTTSTTKSSASIGVTDIHAKSVQITLSLTEELDSDDEDDDEAEEALRRHSLQTIFYVPNPTPMTVEQIKASLEPPSENDSGTWSEDEDILGQSPQPQSQSAYSPSQKQPPEISVRKGNTVRLNSTSSGSNSGKALLALKSQKYFDMNNNRNNAVVTKSTDSPVIDKEITVLPSIVTEQLGIMTKLQQNLDLNPLFDMVLIGTELFFYYSMKLLFSLNINRCGDKKSFRTLAAIEKAFITRERARIMREIEKKSLFFIDSSSESEEEHTDALTVVDETLTDAGPEDDDEVGDTLSVISSTHNDLNRNSNGNKSNSRHHANIHSKNSLTKNGAAPHNVGASVKVTVGQSTKMNISSHAASVKLTNNNTNNNIVHNSNSISHQQKERKKKLVSVLEANKIHDKIKENRYLQESIPPPNYPIQSYVIQIVFHDRRSFSLYFQTMSEYQEWRKLLYYCWEEKVIPTNNILNNNNIIPKQTTTAQYNNNKEDNIAKAENVINSSIKTNNTMNNNLSTINASSKVI